MVHVIAGFLDQAFLILDLFEDLQADRNAAVFDALAPLSLSIG